jgi:hypothetical protein
MSAGHVLRLAKEDFLSPTEFKACEHCGSRFYRDKRCTWAHWGRVRFCTRQCVGLANTAKAEANREPIEVVFSRWFERGDGCWEWNGARDKDGYGIFSYAGKPHRAHVVALQIDGRPVPTGAYGCHHCDNPACVRPSHLYPGTPTQNVADARRRGRLAVGERRSAAKLTEAGVRLIRSSTASNSVLAKQLGVTSGAVQMARAGKTWRHVQ